jgi:hypothetical protein
MSFKIWFLLPTASDSGTDKKDNRLLILLLRRFSWDSQDSLVATEICLTLANESLDVHLCIGRRDLYPGMEIHSLAALWTDLWHQYEGRKLSCAEARSLREVICFAFTRFCVTIRCWFFSRHIWGKNKAYSYRI